MLSTTLSICSNYCNYILSLSHLLEKSFLFHDCFLSFILNVCVLCNKRYLSCRNLRSDTAGRIISSFPISLKSLEFSSISPLTSWMLPLHQGSLGMHKLPLFSASIGTNSSPGDYSILHPRPTESERFEKT